jgi:hypothetical protein
VVFGGIVELVGNGPEGGIDTMPDWSEGVLVREFVMPVAAVVVTTTEGGAMTRVTVGV